MSGEVEDSAPAERIEVFERYRPLVFSIAYTILGTVADAQEMTDETLRRWLKASDHNARKARIFLVTTIATLCIDHLQYAESPEANAASMERSSGPLEAAAVDCPGGSISLNFLIMLNRLTPTERIVFLLRTIYRYEYSQIAQAIGKDEAQCREIAERVKAFMTRNRAAFTLKPSLYVSQI